MTNRMKLILDFVNVPVFDDDILLVTSSGYTIPSLFVLYMFLISLVQSEDQQVAGSTPAGSTTFFRGD